MRKAWLYTLAVLEVILKWFASLAAAMVCILTPYGIPVAVGFMAVTASTMVKDPYLKVIVAAGGSIAAMWLILNAAEVAILLTAFRFKMLIDRYVFHLGRAIDGEPIVVPMPMEAFA